MNNNLLHIAARYSTAKILDYLVTNSRLNVLERNDEGETPLSIAQGLKKKEMIEMLTKSEAVYDETKKNT